MPFFALKLAPLTVALSVLPSWPISFTPAAGARVRVACTLSQGAHFFFRVDHGCVTTTCTPSWLIVMVFAAPVCEGEGRGRQG